MPIRRRRQPAAEEPEDLLDLPLGHVAEAGQETSRSSDSEDPADASGDRSTPERPAFGRVQKQRLGDVDAIGSLERRGRARRGRAGWLWLVLLLAFPLSGLVGYLLKAAPPVAALSADLLDFGEVRVGTGVEQTLRISNQGEQALRLEAPALAGEAAGEFTVATDGCTGLEVSARADCVLRLAFTPAGPGARRAQIRLGSNAPDGLRTVPLIGVGVAPELTVEPPALEFGVQIAGSAGAAAALRLGNRGSAPLQLGRIELRGPATADFRTVADGCSSRLLAPGERCSLRFAFAPAGTGERRAELWIESDAGAPQTAKLTGTGVKKRSPILRLEPAELGFEPLPVAEASPGRTLTLANDGDGPLKIRAIRLEGDDQAAFEMSAESCTAGNVPAGGACEVELRFRPGAEGEVQAVLTIDSNATAEPHRVTVAGTGTAPHAAIMPARLSFGEIAVKASSAPRSVRVASSGSAELILGAITVTGADAASFAIGDCAAVVAPGAECRLEVRFRPARAGPHRADLVIEHNASGRRQALPLNGIGVAARLSVDRASIDFGEVRTGTESQRRLTLTNAGRSELTILRLRLTGRAEGFELDPADCVVAAGASGTILGPSASCTLTVSFRPTSAGSRRLQLVIDHNAAATAREVPIIASATAPPEPAIRLDPTRLDFPNRRVGERSTIKKLTVANPGTARLSLEEQLLAGEHAGDFQLVAGSCASFVAPGASCTVGIRFVPSAAGTRRANLRIRHNAAGGAVELELRGNGTQPSPL